MMRFCGIVTLGGLCATLLPACSSFGNRGAQDPPRPLASAIQEAATRPTPPIPAGSSYHPQPVPTDPTRPAIEQTGAMATTANNGLVPPPLPLVDSPAQPAPSSEPKRSPTAEAKTRPEDSPLVAALRCYLNKQPAEAVIWLQQYDKASQEPLLRLLPLVVRLSKGNLDRANPDEMKELLRQADQGTALLRPRAALVLEKMCFCQDIDTFGVYRPLPPEEYAFSPGKLVYVYVELQNFTSVPQGDVYRIRVTSHLEIRDYRGTPRWFRDISDNNPPELSQSLRHDFSNNYSFRIPRNLATGSYTLLLRVVDVPTGRTAEQTLDFQIVPKHDS
jgi:hypothetical protein